MQAVLRGSARNDWDRMGDVETPCFPRTQYLRLSPVTGNGSNCSNVDASKSCLVVYSGFGRLSNVAKQQEMNKNSVALRGEISAEGLKGARGEGSAS